MFFPFVITDKMCGVCGVSFEKASIAPKTPTTAEGEEKVDEEEEEEVVVVARLKHVHMTSDDHRQMCMNYHAFREMYRTVIGVPLIEIGVFLSKHEVNLSSFLFSKSYFEKV